MREVSAKVVGSLVLVVGAAAALAAGVLFPLLGGWSGGRGTAGPEGPRSTAVAAPAVVGRGQALPTPALPRRRPLMLAGAVDSASRVPASADMVLVVENGAGLRASPLGDAAVRFLLDASGMAQTRDAWKALADQLGWSEAETFDRLLGRRVVLVARDFDRPEATRWALVSDVSAETDTRLKERLTASQRSIDQGHQILTIEKGKYELTSHRRAGADRRPAPAATTVCGDDITIVLGPTGRSELFDEMVGVLAGGAAEPLGERDVVRAAAASGGSEVLLMARLGEGAPAEGDDRWGDFFVLAGGRAGDGDRDGPGADELIARVVYRDRSRTEENLELPVTSDAAFRALIPGSLVTIVQSAPVQRVLGDAARVVDALQELPLPEPARPFLGTRQVLSLRAAETGADPAAAPLSGLVAIEATSTTRLAPHVDGSITRFIAASEARFGLTRPPPHDFGGRLPQVTRALPLEVPEANPLRSFLPDPLTLTWSYPSADGTMSGSTAAGPAASSAAVGPAGWCVMGVTPAPAGLESLPEQAHSAAVEALAREQSREGRVGSREARWIWLGSLHAAALERRLPALLPDLGGFRSAMRRFEQVRVELSVNDAGDIQGDLSATLAPRSTK